MKARAGESLALEPEPAAAAYLGAGAVWRLAALTLTGAALGLRVGSGAAL